MVNSFVCLVPVRLLLSSMAVLYPSMPNSKVCRLGISLIPDGYSALFRTQIGMIYKRILVYIFCLISIGVSDEANKIKILNIERA